LATFIFFKNFPHLHDVGYLERPKTNQEIENKFIYLNVDSYSSKNFLVNSALAVNNSVTNKFHD